MVNQSIRSSRGGLLLAMAATPTEPGLGSGASSNPFSPSDLGDRDYRRRTPAAQRALRFVPCGSSEARGRMGVFLGSPGRVVRGRSMALAAMRRHRRWLFVFLWLVIAAFIILYIPAFQGADAGSPGESMAEVGGVPITVGEFQKLYLRQRQRLEQLYQGRLDPDALRSMGIEEQVFSSLVDDRLVALESRRLGISIDDETLAREVAARFQENGRYIGSDEIRRRLELQGSTVEDLEQSLRDTLLRERLERLVTDGVGV